MSVTGFSSISYYRNSRLISKTDLVRDLQSIVNQKSMFHLKLSSPSLHFQSNTYLSDLVSKLVLNSSIREANKFRYLLYSNNLNTSFFQTHSKSVIPQKFKVPSPPLFPNKVSPLHQPNSRDKIVNLRTDFPFVWSLIIHIPLGQLKVSLQK